MAWIFVQKEMLDKAHIILVEGCKVGSHDTMKKNLERLANNRIREFSNAGLGDEWFALFLEAPKMQIKRQQHPGKFGKPFQSQIIITRNQCGSECFCVVKKHVLKSDYFSTKIFKRGK